MPRQIELAVRTDADHTDAVRADADRAGTDLLPPPVDARPQVVARPACYRAEFAAGWSEEPYASMSQRVLEHELLFPAGSGVVSAAGHRIGVLDGFVVDDDMFVTHVVLRPGHDFGDRDLAVPVGLVHEVVPGRVRIRLCVAEIGEMPPVTVRRDVPIRE